MLRLHLYGGFSLRDDGGVEIPLKSKKARALLACLARPAGKARSREEIIALLWSDRGEAQGRASLRQVLTRLRKDLGEQAQSALRITDDAVALDPDRVVVEPASDGAEFLAGFHLHDPAFEDWLRDERSAEPERSGGALPDQEGIRPSIAVLPFANLSGDPQQQYFSDGITEDIITELNRFQSLFVISGSSSFAFREEETDPVGVGEKLKAQFIIHGSVRTGGNRIRISVQLIDTATGGHHWSERYDREMTDIFAIQDEIASTVATMVLGHVDIASRAKSERKHPADVNAYDLVLMSQWEYYGDRLEFAQILLRRALEIDPNYAEAHARLAVNRAYSVFPEAIDSREVAPLVKQHGLEAARLAPADAMVTGPLCEAFAFVGEHDLAAHHLDRALSGNPNSYLVMLHCAEAMALLGDHAQAVDLVESSMRRDPYSVPAFRETVFDIYFLAARYEDALKLLVGWPSPPVHMALAEMAAQAQLGQTDEAKATLRKLEARRPGRWDPRIVAHNYARMCARSEDAGRWLDGFKKAGLDV